MKHLLVPQSFGETNHKPVKDLHETAITKFIEVHGTPFAYRIFGKKEGIPLILLQHFTGTMDNWDPAITNGLSKEFQVVLFDNKGIGATGGQTPDNIEAMARDAISFIKAVGFAKVNLLGFSMGGFVAQQITLDDPALVNKLILAGTGPKGGEGLANSEKALAATAGMSAEDQKLYFFYESTATSRALGRDSLARINQRAVNRDPDTAIPAIQAQLKAILGWALPDAGSLDRLHQICQPVLIVNGSNDIICPTINSYIMFQQLPDAILSLYPDSGHGSIFQYPELFLAAAFAFLNSNYG
jgi:pimeloyl-ACP methyl ester carboxylesterase